MPDIEQLHTVYLQRRRRSAAGAIVTLSFAALLAIGSWPLLASAEADRAAMREHDALAHSTFLSTTGFMMDTVYTAMAEYLEVRLDSQMLYRHGRDGRAKAIPISTGNPALDKGIETRTGIYVVQNKLAWLLSLQFNSTKVLNWVGFNWGVGFHSLETRGYYRNLGTRPSSHGCIRVAEENAAELFRTVELGTPVFVHKGAYARLVAFSPSLPGPADTMISRAESFSLHARRLKALFDGTRLYRPSTAPLLSRRTIGHTGIPIGDAAHIPARQEIPPTYASFRSWPRLHTAGSAPSAPPRRPAPSRSIERDSLEPTILP